MHAMINFYNLWLSCELVMCMMQCNLSLAHFPSINSSCYIYCYAADCIFLCSGGISKGPGFPGENGTVTGRACPKGLYGTFCKVYAINVYPPCLVLFALTC